jgi:transcriptional regulator with XRE-family HTH domain
LKTLHTSRSLELRQRLRAVREEAGITQQDLAAKLDKPQSFVSKYETGERRLDVIEFVDVCEALEMNAADFLRDLGAQAAGNARKRGASSSRKPPS